MAPHDSFLKFQEFTISSFYRPLWIIWIQFRSFYGALTFTHVPSDTTPKKTGKWYVEVHACAHTHTHTLCEQSIPSCGLEATPFPEESPTGFSTDLSCRWNCFTESIQPPKHRTQAMCLFHLLNLSVLVSIRSLTLETMLSSPLESVYQCKLVYRGCLVNAYIGESQLLGASS